MASDGEGLALVVRRIAAGTWHRLAGGLSPVRAGGHCALSGHARGPQRKLLRRLAPERPARAGFRQLLSPRARACGTPPTADRRRRAPAGLRCAIHAIGGRCDRLERSAQVHHHVSGRWDDRSRKHGRIGLCQRSLAARRPSHGGCGRAPGLGTPGGASRGVAAHRSPWGAEAGGPPKVTAGYAILRDPGNLALFSKPLDQQAVTMPYDSSGAPLAPLVTTFVAGRDLKFPRYGQWSAGAARDLGRRISASAEWMRKRGADGFVYAPAGAPGPVNLDLVG